MLLLAIWFGLFLAALTILRYLDGMPPTQGEVLSLAGAMLVPAVAMWACLQ